MATTRHGKRIRKLIIVLVLILANNFATASNTSKLQHINSKIAKLKAALGQDQKQLQNYQKKLQSAEVNMSRVSQKLQRTQTQTAQQKTILHRLRNSARKYKKQLQEKTKLLEKQLQAVYLLGRQPYLKMLLNQQNPDQIQRILTYYQYLNKDRFNNIKKLQQTLKQVQSNRKLLQVHTQKLSGLNRQQQQERQRLVQLQKNRRQAIRKIRNSINTKQQRLDQLITNKQALEKTLRQLEKTSQTIGGNFSRLKGKLIWPTRGKLNQHFGTKFFQSELRWNGVVIAAPANQPVHAIAEGKVVFARWLQGYGLLIIINHGNGYMTIYGRNHDLTKKIGDTVKAGDVIAHVGQTGGFEQPSLYFAIRHKNTALNPTQWCQKS